MSSRDPLSRGRSMDVNPWVRNVIIIAIGLPPILVLWAVGIAAVGLGYRLATEASLASVSYSLPPVASSDLALVAVLGAVGYLYLIWANVVFGTKAVESGLEQAEQLQDQVEDDDGG